MIWLVRVKIILKANKRCLEKPLSHIKGVLKAQLYPRSKELVLTCGKQAQHPLGVISTGGPCLFLLARAASGLMSPF